MAEASSNWREGVAAGEEAVARGSHADVRRAGREDEWRVLGAGKSLPASFQLGHFLNPQLEERRASGAEAGPALGAQLVDQFPHLSIRKQVSYR